MTDWLLLQVITCQDSTVTGNPAQAILQVTCQDATVGHDSLAHTRLNWHITADGASSGKPAILIRPLGSRCTHSYLLLIPRHTPSRNHCVYTHLAHKLLWVLLPQLCIFIIKAQLRQHHLRTASNSKSGCSVISSTSPRQRSQVYKLHNNSTAGVPKASPCHDAVSCDHSYMQVLALNPGPWTQDSNT